MIQRYLKSPLAATIVSTKEFTAAVSERMGSIKKQTNVRLNLHDSNYISLNTPFNSAPSREDAEYKNSGEKLFNYIKLFLKTKVHSRRGTSRGDSQTRRRDHPSKDHTKTRKHRNNNRKRFRSKTRRIGKIMRI
jgi:hypothetical protein